MDGGVLFGVGLFTCIAIIVFRAITDDTRRIERIRRQQNDTLAQQRRMSPPPPSPPPPELKPLAELKQLRAENDTLAKQLAEACRHLTEMRDIMLEAEKKAAANPVHITKGDYRKIRAVLHPDSNPTKKQKTEAFQIFSGLKMVQT